MSDHFEDVSDPDDVQDVDYLIEQYVAGRLTDDEAARLHQLLRERPELGLALVRQLGVDAMLRSLSEAEGPNLAHLTQLSALVGQGKSARPGAEQQSWWRQSRVVAVAAFLAVLVSAAIALWVKRHETVDRSTAGQPTPVMVASDEPTTATVAVLARTVDAVWADAAAAPVVGSPLEPGWLKLKSGLVEIEFYRGARVVLEGPGELQIVSAVAAYCSAGRLSAEVPPPARGFRIDTPRGHIVDLGTAFGLEVTSDAAEVHVFKGQVEVHPAAQSMHDLKDGEAAEMGGDGRLRLFPANATAFTSPAVLERKSADGLREKYTAWRTASETHNAAPSLLLRFDFEGLSRGDSALANRATTSLPLSPATIIGCGRAEGRWPGKGALEFGGISDRVCLNLPDELPAVTFIASVRVNGLDRQFNSLFMADGFGPGAVHWQILNDGRVRLGVWTAQRPGCVNYDSPVVVTPDRFGQWLQLAVVYDAAAKRVIHYVNGTQVSDAAMRMTGPLRIGSAELGNWDPGSRSDKAPIRHFSGRIDEFAAYRRALTGAEIRSAFKGNDVVGR